MGSSYCAKSSEAEPVTERNNLSKQNKNPNWPPVAKPVGLYKRGQGSELETTENKSSERLGRGLNMLPPDFESNATYNPSATVPPHAVFLKYYCMEAAVVAASNGPFYFSFKAELSLLERTK